MEGGFALLGPLRQCLRKEGEAGNEKKDTFIFTCKFLGDFESGECLSGATCHDKLTTVGIFEAKEGVGESGLLVRAWVVFFLEGRLFGGVWYFDQSIWLFSRSWRSIFVTGICWPWRGFFCVIAPIV